MNFGAHAFVWAGEWNSEAADKIINGAADAGLDFVEIGLLRPDEFDPDDTRKRLEAKNLSATFSLGLPPGATLPDNPDGAEAFLIKVLDKIQATGNHILTGVIYGTLGELPGRRPDERDYNTIAETLKRVAREAAKRDIRIGLEPVNRYETFLINTVDQAIMVVDKIAEDNVFIHLDTYHMNIEEDGFAEAIRRAGSKLGYIHLSESHRGTPGSGTVDWDSVFEGLADIDYRGGLTMESFVAINPDIARATCMWRDIVKDPDALVRDGLAFLRGKAEAYGLK